MKRFAAAFGLLGFVTALLTGAVTEEMPLGAVLWRALAWGMSMALLGSGVGLAARWIVAEADAGAGAAEKSREAAAASEVAALGEGLAARFRENVKTAVEDSSKVVENNEALKSV